MTERADFNPGPLMPLPDLSVDLGLPQTAERIIGSGLRRALDYAKSEACEADTPDRHLPDSATIAMRFCEYWNVGHRRVEWLADRAKRMAGLRTRDLNKAAKTVREDREKVQRVKVLVAEAIPWRAIQARLSQNEAERQLQETLDALNYLEPFLASRHDSTATAKMTRGRPCEAVKAEITVAVVRWWLGQGWEPYCRRQKGGKPESVLVALLSAIGRVTKTGRCLSEPTIKRLIKTARNDPFDQRRPDQRAASTQKNKPAG